jgi:hypothetical protein
MDLGRAREVGGDLAGVEEEGNGSSRKKEGRKEGSLAPQPELQDCPLRQHHARMGRAFFSFLFRFIRVNRIGGPNSFRKPSHRS